METNTNVSTFPCLPEQRHIVGLVHPDLNASISRARILADSGGFWRLHGSCGLDLSKVKGSQHQHLQGHSPAPNPQERA